MLLLTNAKELRVKEMATHTAMAPGWFGGLDINILPYSPWLLAYHPI